MATLLPPAKRQFFDALGNPLASGTVAYFIPSTSTPKNTWQDAGQSTLNTNPITLDAAGEALIYGSGTYRELVKDSLGNTIWDQVTDQPASEIDVQNGVPLWGGTSTGAANTYAITLSPVPGAYLAGQTLRFLTHEANTGAATLNVNGLGAKNITKNGAVALLSGDISNAAVVEVCYDGTNFEIQTAPGTLQVTPGIGLQASATVWSVDPSFFRGYVGGLILSFNSVTVLNIGSGVCVSDDNTTLMKLASAFTKTTGTWAVGSGSGALDTGSVANNTFYAVFIIERPDTGVVDVIFTKEVAGSTPSPSMPANYTKKRYIGTFKTEGTASIVNFVQLGDEFLWTTSVADANATAIGTAASLITLTLPLGVQVNALFRGSASNASPSVALIFTSPDETDQAPGLPNNDLTTANAASSFTSARFNVRTNTSAQIRARAGSASTSLYISTFGWIDTRGRFA